MAEACGTQIACSGGKGASHALWARGRILKWGESGPMLSGLPWLMRDLAQPHHDRRRESPACNLGARRVWCVHVLREGSPLPSAAVRRRAHRGGRAIAS